MTVAVKRGHVRVPALCLDPQTLAGHSCCTPCLPLPVEPARSDALVHTVSCWPPSHAQVPCSAGTDAISRARLLAGRGLALEGDGDFKNALLDYQNAQELALSAKCVSAWLSRRCCF